MIKIKIKMLLNEKGLTLIELLASIAIAGIVITLFVTLSGDTANSDKQNQRAVQAIQLEEQIMNQVRNDISNQQVQNKNTPLSSTQIKSILVNSNYNQTNLDNIYQVMTQYSAFPIPTYSTSSFKLHYVSIQSIVLVKDTATYTNGLVTVTVSWGDS